MLPGYSARDPHAGPILHHTELSVAHAIELLAWRCITGLSIRERRYFSCFFFCMAAWFACFCVKGMFTEDHRASPEVPTTIFRLNSEPRLPLPRPESPRIPHRPPSDLHHRLPPDAAISSLDTTAPSEHSGSAASAPVDWLAEAHRSASEIAARGGPGRAAQSPASPTAPTPWDSRPLLEFTGHGLKLRIPVEIPGHIIDHCFGNMDLGHEQTGQRERFQLGCAFGKQLARGDLFDSLRNRLQNSHANGSERQRALCRARKAFLPTPDAWPQLAQLGRLAPLTHAAESRQAEWLARDSSAAAAS
jgi:hypothetical protein